jgi:hypothetical protein
MKRLDNLQEKLEILRRLRNVRPASNGLWGRMSPHQMICHLKDSFQMAFGEKQVKSIGNIFHRTLAKWIAFSVPLPIPKNRPTLPEINQEIKGTCPQDFEKDLAELVKLVERFAEQADAFYAMDHPIFGTMSAKQWARWGYLHTNHHLRQFGV